MRRRKDTPKPSTRAATIRKARCAAPYAALAAVLGVAVLWPMQLPAMILGALATLGAIILIEARAEAAGIRRLTRRRAARRRRKEQGAATRREARKHMSARAARRKARFTRPQTPGRLAPREAGVHVGTAHGRRLYITHEDSALLIGIRAGKTAFFGDAIWDAPGAVAAFSAFPDLRAHTANRRSETGRLWTLNPGGHGNIPTNFAWSPLDGCETARGALQASGYLVAAAPQDGGGKDAYWIQKARDWLRLYMHAAILGGATILDVRSWVTDPSGMDALTILDNHEMAVPGWADELAQILLGEGSAEEQNSVRSTALSALAWLADPAMAAVACAPPDQWFDAEQFIEDGTGTLYVIGDDNPHNPLTPYLSCLNGHLFETAIRHGGTQPGGRCDPPFMLGCDELALTKPPLHRWSSMAGGRGVTLLAGTQSPSQLEGCWDKAGGDTVFDNMTVLVFGGLKVADNLEKISAAAGEYEAYDLVKGEDGKKRPQPAGMRRTFSPGRIRGLAEGTALLLYRTMRPVVVKVPRVWDRKGYHPATVSPATAPMVPLDGTVTSSVIPGHLSPAALRGPSDAAAAQPAYPAMREASDGA